MPASPELLLDLSSVPFSQESLPTPRVKPGARRAQQNVPPFPVRLCVQGWAPDTQEGSAGMSPSCMSSAAAGPLWPQFKEVSRADTVSDRPGVQTFPRPKFKSITSSSLVSTLLSLRTIRGAMLGVCAPTDPVSLPGNLFRGVCLRSTAADFNNSPRSVCDSRCFY